MKRKPLHRAPWGTALKIHDKMMEGVFRRVYREDSFSANGGRCTYCDDPLSRGAATADHVTPTHKGGRTSRENIVVSCKGCNAVKGCMGVSRFRNMMNNPVPPPISANGSVEVLKAWIRHRINKRVKKAERRIKRYVGMEL